MKDIEALPPDFVKTLNRHVKMIKYYGINIFESEQSSFLKKYGRLMFFSCFLVPMFVGQILYFLLKNKTGASFVDIVNAIPSALMILQDFVKIYVTATKRGQISKLILDIGELWPRDVGDGAKRSVFEEWKYRIHIYDKAYFTIAASALTIFIVVPFALTIYLVNSDKNTRYEFPVQSFFFCFLTSHLQYVMTYTYFIFTCSITHMCIYVSCDLLLICLTFDMSTLLSLLENDLRSIGSDGKPTDEENCEDIKSIVTTHQKLLSLASDMNEIFGAIVFTQVSFSAVIICCFGFLAVIANGMLVRSLTAAVSMVFALFILMWPGQLLVDTSSNIADAAYSCWWYERGVKFRKYISIILIRSQSPCYLSGLGFSELTLANFSKVLSTSWSYLSLLNQMYADTEK